MILDNDVIHSSKQTQVWLRGQGYDRIERRAWRKMHQNVTVNHRHRFIESIVSGH